MVGMNNQAPEEVHARLRELAQAERQLVDDLRFIVWLVDADYDTLPKLLQRMEMEANQTLHGLRYTFEKPDMVPETPIAMMQRKNLFLLYKEALHNVARHSEANHVTIGLCLQSEKITLQIGDDGRGFDAATVRQGQGFKSMQKRAEALGGELTIDSTPGEGTTVSLVARLSGDRRWLRSFLR